MNRIDRLTTLVAGMNSNPECGDIDHENLVKLAAKQLAEIERACPEATGCPQCKKKMSKISDWEQMKINNAVNAEKRLNQGTIDGLTEALRQTDAECAKLRALVEKTIRERDEARDSREAESWKRELASARAAERERCAKIAEESYAELQIEADNQSSDPKANGMLEGVGRIIAIAVAIREGKS